MLRQAVQDVSDSSVRGTEDPTGPVLRPAAQRTPATDPIPLSRIVVLTAGLSYSVRKGIAELTRAFPESEWLIVEHTPARTVRKLLRSQWRNMRKNGLRWLTYQASDVATRVARTLQPPVRFAASPGREFESDALLANPKIRLLQVPDLHTPAVLELVRTFNPDLGLSLAAPILKPPLFDIPRLGTLNLHKGKLPHYRGMPPAFWEFVNGETEVGCTIHRVDRGLDTGPILLQGTVRRAAHSTVRGIQLALDELGVHLLRDAVSMVSEGRESWTMQEAGGKTYRKPTLHQVAEVERRWRSGRTDPVVRRLCKDALFWTYVNVVRPAPRHYLALRNRQRIVVLLYHRVSDEFRDSLTVGIEQFDTQMEWLDRHCAVVDIGVVVRRDIPRDTRRPIVAVTFDDGYLDNYENAVPILLRHRIPAAFFVSTGLIGRDDGFAHDWQRLGRALPTMNWDQLRNMYASGFTIGSHSVTHLDCGRASEEELRGELIESRDVLRRELGLGEVIFAYPFGGRENITPAARRIVRELGFAGCLSAYGGHIGGAIDPYDIERIGIQCNFSMLAFRARLEGFG